MTQQKTIDYALLWLRVAVGGAMLLLHGFGRVPRVYRYLVMGEPWSFVNLVAKIGFPVPPAFALASAVTEFFGALLIIAGLFTRSSAVLLAINMVVAVGFEMSKGGEGAELPGIYLIAIGAIIIAGPGQYSLDELRRRRVHVDHERSLATKTR